jgi:hypothetical protein
MISLFDNQRQPYERPTVTPAGTDPYRLTAPLDDRPGRGEPRQPTTGERLDTSAIRVRLRQAAKDTQRPPAYYAAQLLLDLSAAINELDRLRTHLAGIEWAAADAAGAPAQAICPACRVLKPGPHDPACWLGQVLLAEAKETVKRLAAEADRIYKPGGDPEVERLRGRLRELEWAGVHSWNYEESGCPVCGSEEPGPHKPGCELAAELGR